MRRIRAEWVLALAVLAGTTVAHAGDEIGYIEEFALAGDRTVPLAQLIPGTPDYYYYHCLHHLNTGQFDKVEGLLKLWIERHGRTGQVVEIENRRALLTYEKDPKAALALLRDRLGLHFGHQRELLDAKLRLPTRLDAKLIAREAMTARALARHPHSLDGFEDAALDWLAGRKLAPEQRRALLARLRRPDLPNLPALVIGDLGWRYSRGFGSFQVHRLMLLDQLDECLKLKPDLLNETNFVHAYLSKLHPSADEDWRNDPAAREAYLDRLWAFVSRLAPVHNSLKAHALYHRLVHDRGKGVYDKDRFLAYIALPRPCGYVNQRYLQQDEHRRWRVNLNANFGSYTLLPPVGNDEPLVRSFLLHFFVQEADYKPYATWIDDVYLKRCFAEAKIVNGVGDMEKWYSMLPPSAYQQLKERVDLDFAPTNRALFGPEERVALALDVKNVPSLIVKVYEINAENFYRTHLREMDTDVNLDGLVANTETTHAYKEVPLRRVRRRFEFGDLTDRGTYIVEFIGNGKSSRALVRKGRLGFLVRATTAGHVFTVLDESKRKRPQASIWLSGHRYDANAHGEITVPFSNSPSRQPIVLVDGDFASLDFFAHQSEAYRLSAGIYVDRESLLSRRKATVAVRASLALNGTPVTLSVLREAKLILSSVDHDGVATTKEVKDFELFEDRESTYEFQVPQRLHRIAFALQAKVKNLSRGREDVLSAGAAFTLNQIDRTEKVEDLHLRHVAGRYVLELRGKTGESRADRPVQLTIKHEDFRDTVHASLQTDAAGQVELGDLAEIEWLQAAGAEGTSHRWLLPRSGHTYPSTVHAKVGETIHLPYMGSARQAGREEFSLLETRGPTFVRDRLSHLKLADGFVQVADLPAGDYDLLIKPAKARIAIRVTAGEEKEGHVLGANRHLEVRNRLPLQIASVEAGRDTVRIVLKNATKFARVHVLATRFLPAYSAWAQLGAVGGAEPYVYGVPKPLSRYIAGRNIGEEFRYILERKHTTKLPGNLLTRPGLLLNPWAIRKTEAGQQMARPGEQYGRAGAPGAATAGRAEPKRPARGSAEDFANLDFLASQSVVVLNARPDAGGAVTVERKSLGSATQLHVVAVDPENTACRELSLADQPAKYLDLRLANALDAAGHFTEQKKITVAPKGKAFVLSDVTTSEFEAYDTLARVYALYATLSGDATLAEFGWVLAWPKLQDAEKREKYSKYACHELSFFLSRKDPAFFAAVIKPYLRNKKDKTFLDHWLLGDDLSGYLKPWAYSQLNVVERILLGRRIPGEAPHAARHVKELHDLVPPNIERFNHLFHTALKGRSLDTTEGLGAELDDALKAVEAVRELSEERLARLSKATRAALPATAPPPGRAAEPRPAPRPPAKTAPPPEEEKKPAGREAHDAPADKAKDGKGFYERDERKRRLARQFYRKLDKTQEWVENNYYHLPIEQQNADLVTANAFWSDYAAHDGDKPFLSRHFAEASRSFAEMMLALAVLDLPFEPGEHESKLEQAKLTLTPASDAVVFHKEINPAAAGAAKTPILVSQNFFRHGDRYRHVDNERFDKYVTDEFLVHVAYGCQVVVTNPTSSPQKLDVLVQIPKGAIAVLNGKPTRSVHVDLQPYRTLTFDYYFYFPAAGVYEHFPVHVARNEELIAAAKPVKLTVVEKLSKVDRTSWDYLSHHGTEQQVIEYLQQHNIGRIQPSRIAWRMRGKAYFRQVTALLAKRHVYDHTLWSYGIYHDDVPAIREFLQHCDAFVKRCGSYIDCTLLTIDPVVRKAYQHMEYSPLVNARAHRLGQRRRILNRRFHEQYHRLMRVLSYRRELDDDDLMAVTYYLLLQDRVAEAIPFFRRVRPDKLATRLQHDYFTAYMDFFTDRPRVARGVAAKYADYPVDRWRKAFANVLAQLDEIEGKAARVVDAEDRTQLQTRLADTAPSFEFQVESKRITLEYQNLARCRVNYYKMDIELLFSRNPFMQQHSGHFSYIRPNATEAIDLDPAKKQHVFDLPKPFHSSNVLVEIVGAGVRKSQAYYAHALAVQLIENYGQVKVSHAGTQRPLPKVYVKVYARMNHGPVQFYKDGYTDLRGRFDYTSLNTNELDAVNRFSILILSDEHGAVVREADPPKR